MLFSSSHSDYSPQIPVAAGASGEQGIIHATGLLWSLLKGAVAWLLIQLCFTIPFIAVKKLPSAALCAAGVLMAGAAMWLLRKGRFHAAALFFLTAAWAGTLICAVLSGGIGSIYLVLHLSIPLMTAILLGKRAGLISLVASAAMTLAMALCDTAGHPLPRYFPMPGLSAWMVLMLAFLITTLPVNHTLNALTEALEAAQRQAKRYSHDAFHDRLTDLPNRALFLERLGHCLVLSERHPLNRYAVLFLDLDRFKLVNDSLGHAAGDQLLVEAAKRMSAAMHAGDTVARFGGDEFMVLLEHIDHPASAILVANRIHRMLEVPVALEQNSWQISVSIGIAVGTNGYRYADDVIRDADTAMYHAKALGGGRSFIFDGQIRRQARGVTAGL